MYSTHNEGKSVVAEKFITTLKNKIYKHMASISKDVYFDVLDDIVKKYNNSFHRKIKMKPMLMIILLLSIMKNLMKRIVNLKLEIMLKFQSTTIYLLKDIHLIGVKKSLLWKKIKTLPWAYEINHLNEDEIVGSFYDKELQKTNQKEFRIEIELKRK